MKKINFHIVFILFAAAGILLYRADKPFIGHHDWNSVVYSNIARNYLRYGYALTKFGQVRNHDYAETSEFNYLTHYPPLLPILMSVSFKFLGVSEFSARLVPIAFSVSMSALIYALGKELYNDTVGLVASLLTILTPIYIYFGKLPVHETIVPFFSLLAFWGYIRFNRTERRIHCLFVLLGTLLGGLVNWTGYYIVPAILFHQLLFSQKKKPLFVIALFSLCIFLFIIHLLHIKLLTGNFFGGGLDKIFFDRFNPYETATLYNFSLSKYVKQEVQFLRIYFTNILLVSSFIWLIKQIKFFSLTKSRKADGYLMALFIYGLTHLIVFPQLIFIHDYMIYYLLPYIVLSSAVIIHGFIARISSLHLQKIIFVILVLIISLERLSFIKALLDTDMNSKGVGIAHFINKKAKYGDRIFIGSLSYKELYEVFIGFYADRVVDYGEQILPNEVDNYTLLIRPKAHDALDIKSKMYLDNKFFRSENNEFIWYERKLNDS